MSGSVNEVEDVHRTNKTREKIGIAMRNQFLVSVNVVIKGYSWRTFSNLLHIVNMHDSHQEQGRSKEGVIC